MRSLFLLCALLLSLTSACVSGDEPMSCGALPCTPDAGGWDSVYPLPFTDQPVSYRLPLPGDSDRYRFSAEVGKVYHLQFQFSSDTRMEVSLVDESGSAPADVWHPETATWLLWLDAETPGPYLLKVKVLSGPDGYYRLRLQDMGRDDHGNSRVSARPITSFPTMFEGRIDYGYDADFFELRPVAGHYYRLWCESFTSASVYGSADIYWRGSPAPSPAFRCPESAGGRSEWYATSVEPQLFSLTGLEGAAYRLHIEDLGADDHASTAEAATPISLATPVSGRKEAWADVDGFLLALEAQRRYRVSAVDADGIPLWFYVLGPGGTPIASSDASAPPGNHPVSFEAPVAGIYLLQVGTRERALGDYRLRVDLVAE